MYSSILQQSPEFEHLFGGKNRREPEMGDSKSTDRKLKGILKIS